MSGRGLSPGEDAVEAVTARLAAAAKYRDVHPDTIADVVRRAGEATADVAELERQSRARLHKVAALHLVTVRPSLLRRDLAAADPGEQRAWCRRMLGAHVSTAERLPDLDEFYPALLSLVPPPSAVIDLACALNVFTLPWLRDCTGAAYTGYDLNATFVALGNEYLARDYPGCQVVHADVLTMSPPPSPAADLALLLKTYHCIEGRQPGAGLRLVNTLAAGHMVVSFPTRAMNGRAATFAQRHVEDLAGLAARRGWRFAQASLPTERFAAISKA